MSRLPFSLIIALILGTAAGYLQNYCNTKTDGSYPDPTNCTHFYQCSSGVAYHEQCPLGAYFSVALMGCDWADNVPKNCHYLPSLCANNTDGYYPDPTNCSSYYQCSFGLLYHDTCPPGTYFSVALTGCDWADNVPNCH